MPAPSASPRRGALESWARFAHRRRWYVIGAWVVALVALGVAMRQFGGTYSDSFKLPGSDAQTALDLLQTKFPARSGDTADLVFQSSSGVNTPAIRTRIEEVIAQVQRVPEVVSVDSPFTRPGSISKDGTIARSTVQWSKPAATLNTNDIKAFIAVTVAASNHGLVVEPGGRVVASVEHGSFSSESFGLIAAIVILVVAFGSIVAMGLPVGSALFGLGSAFAILALVANFAPLPSFAPQFAAMIGLGVGIDYSLLVVTRFREGLHTGRSVEDSIAIALSTAGRSVIFAGVVVAIAFLGLFTMGLPFVSALGSAGAIVVGVSVLVAVTLLPSLLSLAGKRVDSLRVPFLHSTEGVDTKSGWFKLSQAIQRRPLPYLLVAAPLLVIMALPLFSMRVGFSDNGNNPASYHSRRAFDLLKEGFGPGFNGPLMLVAESPGRSHLPPGAGSVANPLNFVLTKLSVDLKAQPDVAQVAAPLVLPAKSGGEIALLNVYPKGSPQDASTGALISHLRSAVIPAALAGTGVSVYVGGSTAIFVDFAHVLTGKLPLFIGLVVLLSFLLLSVVFRSLAVPLTGAVMNLLSIGGAFGLLTAVFEWGWLGNLFGVNRPGPIEAFLPVMLFSILFGLSMDYQVFLVTRIHEEYLKSGDNHMAVRNGLAATGKTITAAAVIMILVFGSFILGGQRVIKEFGVGLGGGILIDAVIIRMTIVPAVMQLIGKANWWFPASLDRRLPRLSVDPALEPDSAPGVAPGPAPAPALAAGGSGS